MIKKTITYKDFNDVEHTEDFYFNLTKAEIIEMELTAVGNSFVTHLENVVKSGNGQLIMDTFKSIIFKAYGEKSEDGKRFIKSSQLSLDFSYTGAYNELYVELLTDAEKASEFINGLVPAELAQAAASNSEDARIKAMAQMQGFKKKEEKPKSTVEVVPEIPAGEPVLESYNEHVAEEKIEPDLANMSREELIAHFGNASNVTKQ